MNFMRFLTYDNVFEKLKIEEHSYLQKQSIDLKKNEFTVPSGSFQLLIYILWGSKINLLANPKDLLL